MKVPLSLIREAIREDLGSRGDLTTHFFVPRGAKISGRIVLKAAGVVCGTRVAAKVFRKVAPSCRIRILVPDGRTGRVGQEILQVRGDQKILSAERIALNFLQRLSGIATLTRAFVDQVFGTRAKIYDTRKTLPGWRILDKYAVQCGGGQNHRLGLYDMVLLKDNHWSWGDLGRSLLNFRRSHPKIPVEIEADRLSRVKRALDLGADIILLDNMSLRNLKISIKMIRKISPKTAIEISGGVSLKNVRSLALLGPDRISIGRLTHSVEALDMSLEVP